MVSERLREARKYSDIKSYATVVGFGTESLVQAVTRMQNLGLNATEVAQVLRDFADCLHPKRKTKEKKPA